MNIHGVNDVRQTEIHTAEPLVPEPSAFEFELAIEELKFTNYQVLIKFHQGGKTICSEIHKLIISIWNKEELPEEWKESIIVSVYKKGIKQIAVLMGAFANYVQNFVHHPAVRVNSICRGNYCGSSLWILMQQVNY